MKRFEFTLEAVRILRRRQEQDAMDAYAKALLARQTAFMRLDQVQQELISGWHQLRALLDQGCQASQAARQQEYHRVIEKRRDELTAALATAERRVNAAFQAMLVARRALEIVDKAFSKQLAHHQREVLRGEQKFLDDLASRRQSSVLTWNPAGDTP